MHRLLAATVPAMAPLRAELVDCQSDRAGPWQLEPSGVLSFQQQRCIAPHAVPPKGKGAGWLLQAWDFEGPAGACADGSITWEETRAPGFPTIALRGFNGSWGPAAAAGVLRNGNRLLQYPLGSYRRYCETRRSCEFVLNGSVLVNPHSGLCVGAAPAPVQAPLMLHGHCGKARLGRRHPRPSSASGDAYRAYVRRRESTPFAARQPPSWPVPAPKGPPAGAADHCLVMPTHGSHFRQARRHLASIARFAEDSPRMFVVLGSDADVAQMNGSFLTPWCKPPPPNETAALTRAECAKLTPMVTTVSLEALMRARGEPAELEADIHNWLAERYSGTGGTFFNPPTGEPRWFGDAMDGMWDAPLPPSPGARVLREVQRHRRARCVLARLRCLASTLRTRHPAARADVAHPISASESPICPAYRQCAQAWRPITQRRAPFRAGARFVPGRSDRSCKRSSGASKR